jgi:predicted O-linked N-acetylglucosamine transferase (SPINDLY family)
MSQTPADKLSQARCLILAKDFEKSSLLIKELLDDEPDNHLAWANLSIINYSNGDLSGAIRCLDRSISISPTFAQAYINKAQIEEQLHDTTRAILTLRLAVDRCNENSTIHLTLGIMFSKAEMDSNAIIEFTRALSIDSDCHEACLRRAQLYHKRGLPNLAFKDYESLISIGHFLYDSYLGLFRLNLEAGQLDEAQIALSSTSLIPELTPVQLVDIASAYYQLENWDMAIVHYSEALRFYETHPNTGSICAIAYELAICNEKLDNNSTAEDFYRQVLSANPESIQSLVNLGNLLMKQGRNIEGYQYLKNTISLEPDCENAHYSLGNYFFDVPDFLTAERHYKNCLQSQELAKWAYMRLGIISYHRRHYSQAQQYFTDSLAIDPDFCESLFNLGLVYSDLTCHQAAIECFQSVLTQNPYAINLYYNLANQYYMLNLLDKAILNYRKELSQNPDHIPSRIQLFFCERATCDWAHYDENLSWINSNASSTDQPLPPWQLLSFSDNPKLEQDIATSFARNHNLHIVGSGQSSCMKKASRPIKIGFFSSDFYNHATMHLIEPFLYELDPACVSVYIYDYSSITDSYTQKLQQSHFVYRYIYSLDTGSVVDMVNEDQLDGAIDLKGYTTGSRLDLFCQRLAPIHISYLGYPGTSGSNIYDYIIADSIVAPPEFHNFYSEKVALIDGCFQPNNPDRPIANDFADRKVNHLPNGAFVFCSFNSTYKIGRDEFDVWMRILSKTDSYLWLLSTNVWAESNLRQEACTRGIDPMRLIFTQKVENSQHLARHLCADLQLDTFSVNAHTTAADSILVGLPILTKIGQTFSSRVCASILKAAELDELITYSTSEYEEKAIYMVENPVYLQSLKERLQASRRNLPLFNVKQYAQNFEKLICSLLL